MKLTASMAATLGVVMGLTATFGSVSEAHAQQAPQQERQCLADTAVEDMLRERASELNTGAGTMRDGVLLELFTSESGGFTFVINENQGERCLHSAGGAMIDVDESEVPFALPPQDLTPQQSQSIAMMVQGSRGSCSTPEGLFNSLSTRYQEEPRFVGRSGDGAVLVLVDTPDGALKTDGSPSDDSWTLVRIQQDHPNIDLSGAYSACITGAGDSWTDIEPESDVIVGPNIEVSATITPALGNN